MARTERQTCRFCGQKFPKEFKVQCPSCKQFNIDPPFDESNDGVISLEDAEDEDVDLVETGEWDPCFGRDIIRDKKGKATGEFKYGLPRSSVMLLGGKNGAGKTTLVLQICEKICKDYPKDNVLIVSVEEAAAQVKRVGKRLQLKNMKRMKITKGDRELSPILTHYKPQLIVVDSVSDLCPILEDAVEFAKRLKAHVEQMRIPAILISHINKEEEFAGLEKLQHVVDGTQIFTIYRNELRELRSLKNRNGALARVFFDMTDEGLSVVSEEQLIAREKAEDDDDED